MINLICNYLKGEFNDRLYRNMSERMNSMRISAIVQYAFWLLDSPGGRECRAIKNRNMKKAIACAVVFY